MAIGDNLGFVLIKFGDLGPEPVYIENPPFDKEMEESFGVQLGIYLSLMINKGTNEAELQLGLNGPFSWNHTPDHNVLTFAFLGRDPYINDSRAKEFGVFMIFGVFYENTDQELVKAKLSINNSLTEFLHKESLTDFFSVEEQDIPLLIAQIKTKLFNSMREGNRIVQEKSMDVLLSNSRLEYLGLYDSETKNLIAPIIGEEEEFSDILVEGKNLNFDIFFTTFHSYRFGLIRLSKYNKIAIVVLSNESKDSVFMEKDFLDLYQAIYTAAPLLEEYYGI